ncbi:MAG: hypothetical protein BWY21_02010 [Parcubacteria group bacterium ADurb.Bin216]|nr:MAG: hypothetical protein BWY21_02010 [Parcubacteria group bacterium ADurb.Bin216]
MVVIGPNQGLGKSDKYEWKSASVNVAGTSGNTNLKSIPGFTTLFNKVGVARKIRVESSATAYVTLNGTGNDVITVTATTPFEAEMSVSSIGISTGGSASTVTVKLFA